MSTPDACHFTLWHSFLVSISNCKGLVNFLKFHLKSSWCTVQGHYAKMLKNMKTVENPLCFVIFFSEGSWCIVKMLPYQQPLMRASKWGAFILIGIRNIKGQGRDFKFYVKRGNLNFWFLKYWSIFSIYLIQKVLSATVRMCVGLDMAALIPFWKKNQHYIQRPLHCLFVSNVYSITDIWDWLKSRLKIRVKTQFCIKLDKCWQFQTF